MEGPPKKFNLNNHSSPKLQDGSRIPDGLYFVELHKDAETATIYKFIKEELIEEENDTTLEYNPRGEIIWKGGWRRAANWVQTRPHLMWRKDICFVVKQRSGPIIPRESVW